MYRLVFLAAAVLSAQTAPETRTAAIEAVREAKSAKLSEEKPTPAEQRLIYIKEAKVLERISAGVGGLRVKIGGMPTGSGFALGPDYFRDDLAGGKVVMNAGLQGSARRWWRGGASVAVPAMARGKMFWEAYAVHRDYNSVTYYGPGPESREGDRSTYRLEDTSFDTLLGVKPHKWVRFGASTGYLLNNVGPGRDERFASAETLFGQNPLSPGFDQQTDFWRWGTFGQVDYRDNAAGPRAGGNYTMRFDDYRDRQLHRHDFRRLDFEAQQYIPLFNKRRVIALRARSVTSFLDSGQTLPFYQQAVLGGSDDLRGFRPYRFHGNNLAVANLEYRWEVFSGLDMAIFGDAGQVSNRKWQYRLKDMETSVGFGFRFNVRNAPFLRLDVGFSHEGFQVFMKFNGMFGQRPWGSSSASHIQ
ncbi:MAG: BamA/TamA family outer membrane protein [Bryobacterales bacterium]|nr:BamA/TamA family outer membrane protein [Bryobacterales bacterium]